MSPRSGCGGMGGVGKTTLMKQIMRLAREKNLFTDVAMATVSQNPDVKKIQGEISVLLDLKLGDGHDQNVRERASRLHMRLKNNRKSSEAAVSVAEKQDAQQKQVLIILDDLWGEVDLGEIGIPRDEGGVKLLFTSRNHAVLSGEMGCKQVLELDVLKNNEPWSLFESIVGEKSSNDRKLRQIGKEVVEKCSGLPVVIKGIATTLKSCSLLEWRDALEQVRRSKDAYSNLELSFKHLESEELKSFFLVCALTGNAQTSVEDLFYYGMGLGLLKGANTVRIAIDRTKGLRHRLQDSSLLVKDENLDEYVKIHDVVREVAVRIASRDHFVITDGHELKDVPREKLKNCKVISIPYVKFQKFPERWECPELKMFLLYRDMHDSPISFSDSFFEGMRELRVLNFSGRCFDYLPSSIQFLLNLNTLCLDMCPTMDLTVIGKLKQLQILTFRGSKIDRLPKEFGGLTDLKVLNLRGCTELEIIDPQVLENMTSLEELHMRGSNFKQWEDEGETERPSNAKVSELNSMRKLSRLDMHVYDATRLPEHLEVGNLAEYMIQIGNFENWSDVYKESRILRIKLDSYRINFLREKWLQDLLKRTQDLHLEGLKGRKKSIHELCLDEFQELKHLHVLNSASVQCITYSLKWFPRTSFTLLETLCLENLSEFEMISRGPLAAGSFSQLKVIKVVNCRNLKNLFCYSILKGLSHLEEIEVRDCPMLQEIVTIDVATNEAVRLQALRRIELSNLPNIMRFCSNPIEVNNEELRSAEIDLTNTLFPSEQLVVFPVLESLILNRLPKLKNIWQNNCLVEVVSLKYLEIDSCEDLLGVIPSSLVTKFGNLETLIIIGCRAVEEIFGNSHGAVPNLPGDMEILSRLKQLTLIGLSCLRDIWSEKLLRSLGKVRAFQNLKFLKVGFCNSLKNIFPGAIFKVQSLGQLTEIRVGFCEKIEEIISVVESTDGGEGEIMTVDVVFHSLVKIFLDSLPNMDTFLRAKRDQSIYFLSLNSLFVLNCPKMRRFCLARTGGEGADNEFLSFFDHKVLLPKLVDLDLYQVGMETIWHKEIPEQSFCQLESLSVSHCQNLMVVFPSNIMMGSLQFQNLQKIYVGDCRSLKGSLFQSTGEDFKKSYLLPQLKSLELWSLPELEHVVEPTSNVVLGFPNLKDISISSCHSLIDLFPISTAQTCSKLDRLRIDNCNRMRHVFERTEVEEEEEMANPILFPYLHSMSFEHLDNLIYIFLGTSCVLDFPSLETLDISQCPNLNTFVQRHPSDQLKELPPNRDADIHYLFDDQVEFSNLKSMKLRQLSSLHIIWKNEHSSFGTSHVGPNPCGDIESTLDQINELELYDMPNLRYIGKVRVPQSLKVVKVENCNSLKNLFPIVVLKALGKLVTEIHIKNCEKMEEIISEIENDDGGEMTTTIVDVVFHSLIDISLENLPNLNTFVRTKRYQSINFLSLNQVSITNCPKMTAISLAKTEESADSNGVESLPLCFFDRKVSLPTLVRLTLRCDGLVGLMSTLAATSLLRITKIDIYDCEMIQEIVVSDDGSKPAENTISFRELKHLGLHHLKRLTSFSSTNCTFEFPSLTEVIVIGCPNLKMFTKNSVVAPKLSKVQLTWNDDDGQWDGDLNTTIKNLQK